MNLKPVVLQSYDWNELCKFIRDARSTFRTGASRHHLDRILEEIESQSASPSRELCELAFKENK